ncbi:MAG: helix-turn-helix domain-containing protein [Verrucomicrobiota bacterium]
MNPEKHADNEEPEEQSAGTGDDQEQSLFSWHGQEESGQQDHARQNQKNESGQETGTNNKAPEPPAEQDTNSPEGSNNKPEKTKSEKFAIAGKQRAVRMKKTITSNTQSNIDSADSESGEKARGLGEKLRTAREESGLSIIEVAQQTKVSAQFINFLEDNKFSQLPPAVYCKSYIRKLAREYAIDPEPLINDYLEHTGQAGRAPSAGGRFVVGTSGHDDATVGYQPASVERKEHISILDRISRTAIIAAIIGLVAVVIAAFAVQQYRNWRISQAEKELEDGAPVFEETETIDLEKFIMPRQLPLKELAIPGQENQ